MKIWFLQLAVVLFLPLTASAYNFHGGYLYEGTFYTLGKNYLRLLSNTSTDRLEKLDSNQKNICENLYGTLLKDDVLDIRIALGYFDWTTGSSVYLGGTNYGLSPSMDLGGYAALRAILTSSCRGNNKLCGFRQDSTNMYRFSRPITVHGRNYTARVEVHFSSSTELLSRNIGRNYNDQLSRSQYTESFFRSGLKNADVTFYFGHSRNGGGPDFNPPVFLPGRNKLDYAGYYKAKQPGMRKMLSSLQDSSNPTRILGLFSCDSRDHFLRKVRSASPNTGVITSLDILTVDEVWTSMLGGLDSMLRGQCQKSFYQSLRMTSRNQRFMTMDGVFN
jgi:hypothetical protein